MATHFKLFFKLNMHVFIMNMKCRLVNILQESHRKMYKIQRMHEEFWMVLNNRALEIMCHFYLTR